MIFVFLNNVKIIKYIIQIHKNDKRKKTINIINKKNLACNYCDVVYN